MHFAGRIQHRVFGPWASIHAFLQMDMRCDDRRNCGKSLPGHTATGTDPIDHDDKKQKDRYKNGGKNNEITHGEESLKVEIDDFPENNDADGHNDDSGNNDDIAVSAFPKV